RAPDAPLTGRAIPLSSSLPVEELDVAERGGLGMKQEDGALAVGPVRGVHEVAVRLVGGRLAHPAHVPDRAHRLRGDEVLGERLARLVDVRVDGMCREVPGAWSEVDADVAADRPEPHVPSPEAQRRQPEAEVVALMDGVPRLLESRILT